MPSRPVKVTKQVLLELPEGLVSEAKAFSEGRGEKFNDVVIDALRRLGTSDWHRRSWRLPGTMDDAALTDPAADPLAELVTDLTPQPSRDAAADLTRVGER